MTEYWSKIVSDEFSNNIHKLTELREDFYNIIDTLYYTNNNILDGYKKLSIGMNIVHICIDMDMMIAKFRYTLIEKNIIFNNPFLKSSNYIVLKGYNIYTLYKYINEIYYTIRYYKYYIFKLGVYTKNNIHINSNFQSLKNLSKQLKNVLKFQNSNLIKKISYALHDNINYNNNILQKILENYKEKMKEGEILMCTMRKYLFSTNLNNISFDDINNFRDIVNNYINNNN